MELSIVLYFYDEYFFSKIIFELHYWNNKYGNFSNTHHYKKIPEIFKCLGTKLKPSTILNMGIK